ncbi:TIGR03619 family F420-dependent LLM class oxidoreductase [Sphingomonadaceae bacterium G21617-S1]|nr:TIGR03619 family F420-dependent LLM class oxidoreductase [Sphingomonadaceae bacterium G21617-S1]
MKMHIGVYANLTTGTMPIIELARALEERGIESLTLSEHTHTPVTTEPDSYHDEAVIAATRDSPSPFVVLAAAAAVTKRLRVGTSVCLPGQYDPLIFAKQVATLDRISDGRVFLGCGFGWNKAEMMNHGVDPKRRRSNLRARIRAVRDLWEQDTAECSSEYASFTASWSLPKPVQSPGPKLFLGAPAKPQTFEDIIELFDGWMPAARFSDDLLAEELQQLDQAIADAGRSADDFSVTMIDSRAGLEPYPPEEFVGRCVSADQLMKWKALGINRAIIGVPVHSADLALPMLDHIANLSRAVS